MRPGPLAKGLGKRVVTVRACIPAGTLIEAGRSFRYYFWGGQLLHAAPERPGQFGDIVIRNVNGFPVKFRDVAPVREGPADQRSPASVNGQCWIPAGVIRSSTDKPLTLSDGVRECPSPRQAQPHAGSAPGPGPLR